MRAQLCRAAAPYGEIGEWTLDIIDWALGTGSCVYEPGHACHLFKNSFGAFSGLVFGFWTFPAGSRKDLFA